MRVLIVNKFLFPKGGDAVATRDTAELLSARGHEVALWGMSHPNNPPESLEEHFIDYVDYDAPGGLGATVRMGVNVLYSREASRKISSALDEFRPDLVHLHNFAHQISPSVLEPIARRGIPAVMTMHDYKLVCASYELLREGRICEACAHGRHYNALRYRCVKNSLVKSTLASVEMHLHHHILHIYDKISKFIAPSRFLKDKVEEMGMKGEVAHLPNFVRVSEFGNDYPVNPRKLIYFGRLIRTKGVHTLLEAARPLDAELTIVGEGPMEAELRQQVDAWAGAQKCRIQFTGFLRGEDLLQEIGTSLAVVLPSEWYENNPRSIIEAFAMSKPVIGARIGGIPELVRHGETGYCFKAGDAGALTQELQRLLAAPERAAEMGAAGRRLVETELNEDRYYEGLIRIYEETLGFTG